MPLAAKGCTAARARLREALRPVDDDAQRPSGKGALLDVIEVEARLEAELASARAEAEQIVETARAEAETLRLGSKTEIESRLRELRASIERECEAAIQDLEARTRAEEERYANMGEDELQELARWLAAQLVGIGAPP